MVATDLGRAALVGSVPAAYGLGVLTLPQLYVIAFLEGTLSVLFYVSYSTLFTSLVPRERYVEGNQLVNGSRAFSFVGGQSLAGFLVQHFSAPFALLAASLASTAFVNFFNFVFFALFVLYATRELHVRPGTLGIVLGAGAVGGVVGALVTGRIARRIGIGPAFVAGSFLFPAPFLLVPLAGGGKPLVIALLFLAELGSGFGVMMLDITIGSIQQALIPDRLRARVSGAYMVVNYGVRPLGSLLGGLLGSTIGIRPTLWIAAAGGICAVLFLLPSPAPRLRDLPEPAA
jgi:predicted MFS family arabinose efflux permease